MVTLLATSAGSQAPAGLTPTSQPVNLLYADSCKQAGALVHPATQEASQRGTCTMYTSSTQDYPPFILRTATGDHH